MTITYHYKTRLTSSTKPSVIYDENENPLGTILRVYNNAFQRIIGWTLSYKRFRNYEIRDTQGVLIFKSIERTKFVGKRIQDIYYLKDNQEYRFELRSKEVIWVGEKVEFQYNGKNCYIQNSPLNPPVFAYNGSIVAEWKVNLKPPFRTELKLLNDKFKDDVLLIIGVLHTYYLIEGS